MIEVYKDTLVPASLVGLFSKFAGLLLSGYIGGLVDSTPRLRLVRVCISAEKVLNSLNYGLFLVLFGPLRHKAQDAFHGRADIGSVLAVWGIIILTVIFSAITTLANTGLTVAVERDWVTTIADGQSKHLTLLNTSIRRIDLFSKLCAPVSEYLELTRLLIPSCLYHYSPPGKDTRLQRSSCSLWPCPAL